MVVHSFITSFLASAHSEKAGTSGRYWEDRLEKQEIPSKTEQQLPSTQGTVQHFIGINTSIVLYKNDLRLISTSSKNSSEQQSIRISYQEIFEKSHLSVSFWSTTRLDSSSASLSYVYFSSIHSFRQPYKHLHMYIQALSLHARLSHTYSALIYTCMLPPLPFIYTWALTTVPAYCYLP